MFASFICSYGVCDLLFNIFHLENEPVLFAHAEGRFTARVCRKRLCVIKAGHYGEKHWFSMNCFSFELTVMFFFQFSGTKTYKMHI